MVCLFNFITQRKVSLICLIAFHDQLDFVGVHETLINEFKVHNNSTLWSSFLLHHITVKQTVYTHLANSLYPVRLPTKTITSSNTNHQHSQHCLILPMCAQEIELFSNVGLWDGGRNVTQRLTRADRWPRSSSGSSATCAGEALRSSRGQHDVGPVIVSRYGSSHEAESVGVNVGF